MSWSLSRGGTEKRRAPSNTRCPGPDVAAQRRVALPLALCLGRRLQPLPRSPMGLRHGRRRIGRPHELRARLSLAVHVDDHRERSLDGAELPVTRLGRRCRENPRPDQLRRLPHPPTAPWMAWCDWPLACGFPSAPRRGSSSRRRRVPRRFLTKTFGQWCSPPIARSGTSQSS